MEVNENNKIQYSFIKGRLCETNLFFFLCEITDFFDKVNAVDLIYLNLSKVFPTVSCSKSSCKMEMMAINMGMMRGEETKRETATAYT